MLMIDQLDQATIARLRMTSKLFKGFADYTRLSIFEALTSGEKTVTEITSMLQLNQSTVSNHLRCLKECELVKDRQVGKYCYYSIRNEDVVTMLTLGKTMAQTLSEEKYRCMQF